MTLKQKIGMVVAAILTATTFSFAQSYSLVPNDTINMTGMLEDLETLSIQQQNNSTDTIHLKWKKISESMPLLWEASVCDNAACNTSLVDSGIMNQVIPSDYGFLLLHITPHVNYGTAIIRYEVWNIINPLLRDTLTYILTVTATSGTKDSENNSTFNIYPNPANESFSISTNLPCGFQFLISDVSGKEIDKGISKANTISISSKLIPKGIYAVSVFSHDEILNTKQFLIYH